MDDLASKKMELEIEILRSELENTKKEGANQFDLRVWIPVIGGSIAAFATILTVAIQSKQARDLASIEDARHKHAIELEDARARSEAELEKLRTQTELTLAQKRFEYELIDLAVSGHPGEQAVSNLKFLAQSGLLTENQVEVILQNLTEGELAPLWK